MASSIMVRLGFRCSKCRNVVRVQDRRQGVDAGGLELLLNRLPKYWTVNDEGMIECPEHRSRLILPEGMRA